jgi:regulator of cell morphogenesis and NO signaling
MTTSYAQTPVGQLVCGHPRWARVLEEFGIDYCCGGKRTLEEACEEKQLDLVDVCQRLDSAAAPLAGVDDTDWRRFSLGELIDHIVAVHHSYLRCEFPRLSTLLDKVVAAHQENHPELAELRDVFLTLTDELSTHMMKEEQILFPRIRQLEQAGAERRYSPYGVSNPIRVMEHEHRDAAELLARMKRLTGDYRAPADACTTYRVLLDSLAALERDLHLHIHKENNILFPRAAELEAAALTQV